MLWSQKNKLDLANIQKIENLEKKWKKKKI